MNFIIFRLCAFILTFFSTNANIYFYDKFTNRNVVHNDFIEKPFYCSKAFCSIDYVSPYKSQNISLKNHTLLLRNESKNKSYFDANYIYILRGNYTYHNQIIPKLTR